VTSVRNAEEFLQVFRRLRAQYEEILAPLVAKVREEYTRTTGLTSTSAIDENLEAHARVYLVNAFFEALNWRFDESVYIQCRTYPHDPSPSAFPSALYGRAKGEGVPIDS
jgi:hypothetical protein